MIVNENSESLYNMCMGVGYSLFFSNDLLFFYNLYIL